MNQIYVILGAPFWRAAGKKVGLWYAHGTVSRSLQLAVKPSHIVFTSTKEGMRIETNKRAIVGQGIDTDFFKPLPKETNTILQLITVGRLSQSKNIETLLDACTQLKNNNIAFHFSIIGPAITPTEERYAEKIKKQCDDLGLEKEVTWVGAISQSALPAYLQKAEVFIHDGSTDSLDKALLEAVLCGCVVVSSNPAYRAITEKLAPALLFSPHDAPALASTLQTLSHQPPNIRQQIMQPVFTFIHESYSISKLISGIVSRY